MVRPRDTPLRGRSCSHVSSTKVYKPDGDRAANNYGVESSNGDAGVLPHTCFSGANHEPVLDAAESLLVRLLQDGRTSIHPNRTGMYPGIDDEEIGGACITARLIVGSATTAEAVAMRNRHLAATTRIDPQRARQRQTSPNPRAVEQLGVAILDCASSHTYPAPGPFPFTFERWHTFTGAYDTGSLDIVTYYTMNVRTHLTRLLTRYSDVLIACPDGLNVSCAVVALHLLDRHGLSLREAIGIVLRAQPFALTNRRFLRPITLYALQREYAMKHAPDVPPTSSAMARASMLLGFSPSPPRSRLSCRNCGDELDPDEPWRRCETCGYG